MIVLSWWIIFTTVLACLESVCIRVVQSEQPPLLSVLERILFANMQIGIHFMLMTFTSYFEIFSANDKVHHCLIQRTADGYGFAEPFNLHQTVEDLVLHYAENSLIPHNEKLDTKLLYPVGCYK